VLGAEQYCAGCLEAKVAETPNAGLGYKKPWLAFILSLMPGVGYLYLGLMRRGLQTMVVFYGTIFIAAALNFEQITALVLPVTLFYTIFDTLQLLKKNNEGQQVEDKPLFDVEILESKHVFLGYGLIFLGLIALANNLLPQSFAYHHYLGKIIPPVLILGLGIYILFRNAGKKE
jgi:TM2 domain-containing membrane protein YozV